MPPTPDALTTRVRELLGKAQVVYWDDTEASDRLRALQHSLEDTDGSLQVTPTDDPGRAGEALAQLRALLTENPRRGSETVASDCAALAGSVTVRPADSTPAPTLEQPHEEESDAAGVAGLAPEDAARARELLTASAAGDLGATCSTNSPTGAPSPTTPRSRAGRGVRPRTSDASSSVCWADAGRARDRAWARASDR